VRARQQYAECERHEGGSPSLGPGKPWSEANGEAATERDDRKPVKLGGNPAEKTGRDRHEVSAVHALWSRFSLQSPSASRRKERRTARG